LTNVRQQTLWGPSPSLASPADDAFIARIGKPVASLI